MILSSLDTPVMWVPQLLCVSFGSWIFHVEIYFLFLFASTAMNVSEAVPILSWAPLYASCFYKFFFLFILYTIHNASFVCIIYIYSNFNVICLCYITYLFYHFKLIYSICLILKFSYLFKLVFNLLVYWWLFLLQAEYVVLSWMKWDKLVPTVRIYVFLRVRQ